MVSKRKRLGKSELVGFNGSKAFVRAEIRTCESSFLPILFVVLDAFLLMLSFGIMVFASIAARNA